ncbi:MAG: helix-turn-helix domain-containing protein [Chloroflexota bacterium]|nr:helix-turn-helix domain-containing protein [Chloroflexota bacterium]
MAIVTRRTPKSHLKVKDERNVEYFQVSNSVIDEWAARLSHATFKVYLALHRFAVGSDATVAYKTLCAKLDMSSATVARALETLAAERLVRVEHYTSERGVDVNTYVLLPIPVTFISEVTQNGDFTDESHPASLSEDTPLHSVKQLKTDQEKDIKDKEMWRQLALLGIPDRPSYIRLVGRGMFDDPIQTVEFARRKLAEKQRRA